MTTAETKYQVTKEQCEAQIAARPVVCRRCGGPLSALETVDNSMNPTYWSGCEPCQHFDCGVDAPIFKAARWLVTERRYIAYTWMQEPRELGPNRAEWIKAQTSGAVHGIQDVFAALEATK